MQRARQHIPSFMGAYIPPCGDVTGGVVIRIGDKATVCASERFAVPYSDMQTFGTSLGGVRRRYGNDIHTRKFTLVFKETAEFRQTRQICVTTAAHYPLWTITAHCAKGDSRRESYEAVPAWSLSSLLSLLPTSLLGPTGNEYMLELSKLRMHSVWEVQWWNGRSRFTTYDKKKKFHKLWDKSPIEACVKAIEWLTERGYKLNGIEKGGDNE